MTYEFVDIYFKYFIAMRQNQNFINTILKFTIGDRPSWRFRDYLPNHRYKKSFMLIYFRRE